jgi:hypothetical protein
MCCIIAVLSLTFGTVLLFCIIHIIPMLKDSTTQFVLLAGNKKEKETQTHKQFQELILFLLHPKKKFGVLFLYLGSAQRSAR